MPKDNIQEWCNEQFAQLNQQLTAIKSEHASYRQDLQQRYGQQDSAIQSCLQQVKAEIEQVRYVLKNEYVLMVDLQAQIDQIKQTREDAIAAAAIAITEALKGGLIQGSSAQPTLPAEAQAAVDTILAILGGQGVRPRL